MYLFHENIEDPFYSDCNYAYKCGCKKTLVSCFGERLTSFTEEQLNALVDQLFDVKKPTKFLMCRLINQTVTMNIIDAALVLGNLDIFQELKSGILTQNQSSDDLSPMHWMGLSHCVDDNTVTKIVDHLVKLDPRCIYARTAKGYSPLHITSKHGKNVVVLSALLQAGSPINNQTTSGYTALHCCCLHNPTQSNAKEAMMNILLQCGADLSYQTLFKRTVAETIAQNYESIHLLKLLLRYGLTKDMLGNQFSSFRMERHLLRHPECWDIIIPLIETGYRFKFHLSFTCKPSHSKIQTLQSEVPSLQRLASNVIRTCLNPGFYPKLCQVTCIPKCLKEYIMFEDILNL